MADIQNLTVSLYSNNPKVYQAAFVLSAVPTGGLATIENIEVNWRTMNLNGTYDMTTNTVNAETDGVLNSADKKYHYQNRFELPENATGLWVRTRMVAKSNSKWKTTSWSSWVPIKTNDSDPISSLSSSLIPVADDPKITEFRTANVRFSINASSLIAEYRKYLTMTVYVASNGVLVGTWPDAKITFLSDGTGYAEITVGCSRGTVYEAWAVTEYKNASNILVTEPSEHSAQFSLGPATPEFKEQFCGTKSGHEIYLEWTRVEGATSYEVVWANKAEYLRLYDMGLATIVTVNGTPLSANALVDTNVGGEYWFMVRAVNDFGSSDWSWVIKRTVGSIPAVPTTWSSKSKIMLGNADEPDLYLNWVHNASDGSREYNAWLQLDIVVSGSNMRRDVKLEKQPQHETAEDTKVYEATIFDRVSNSVAQSLLRPTPSLGSDVYASASSQTGVTKQSVRNASTIITHELFNYDGQDEIYDTVTTFNLSEYLRQLSIEDDPEETRIDISDISSITWKVKTAGALVDAETDNPVYGPYSVSRIINVYSNPNVNVIFTNSGTISEAIPVNRLVSYPFYLYAFMDTSNNFAQVPLYYKVEIKPRTTYTRVNVYGAEETIPAGYTVYSKSFDNINSGSFFLKFTAGDMIFENGITYDAYVTVVTNLGCSVSNSQHVTIALNEGSSDVQIGYDYYYSDLNAAAYVKPYVYDASQGYTQLMSGYYINLYRINQDHTLSLVVENAESYDDFYRMRYYPDPFSTMRSMQYRIVAINKSTGAMIFMDTPTLNNDETGVIFQWGDAYDNMDVVYTDTDRVYTGEDNWFGNILRLKYNVDVTENTSVDVNKVNYIGRKDPVAYYGTAVNKSWTVKADIPSYDSDSLTMIRRLSEYTGAIYFRESSGIGFWASCDVNLTRNHGAVVTSVSINITKVSG